MKRFLALYYCFLCVVSAFSAHIQVQWQPIQTFTTDSLTVSALSVANGIYSKFNILPSQCVALQNNVDLEIVNAVYADLSEQEQKIAKTCLNVIPSTLEFAVYGRTERKKTNYFLEVFPFVKAGDKVQKLMSYDTKEKTVSHPQKMPQKSVAYAENSVLSSGNFVKIAVAQNGIYKLTYEDLTAMGVNPKQVRIFGYGGAMLNEDFSQPYIDDLPEVAVYEYKGSDGVFGAGDYILFYGQGPTSWKFYSYGTFRHTQNVYSNYGYYFVTSDKGEGKRITPISPVESMPIDDVTSFTDYFVHEIDKVNLVESGREFYGEKFDMDNLSQSFSFDVPNLLPEQASFRLDVAARSQLNSSFTAFANSSKIGALSVYSMLDAPTYVYAKTATSTFYFSPLVTNKLNVTLTYSDVNGLGWLNFFEVNCKRKLAITSKNPLFFCNFDSLDLPITRRFVVDGASEATQVWNVTNPSSIVQMPTTYADGKTTFVDSVETLHQYVAVNPANGSFLTPTVVGKIANQNLHALPQTDFVIVAPAEFMSEAKRLATAHAEIQGLSVQVIDVQQVYNEFSSGTPDATAYRRLMKLFYDRAASDDDMPKYLLLFGDGTYDNRLIALNAADHNKLLTFQSYNSVHGTESYVCDDYFAFLDDNEGVNLTKDAMDIGVGRFPVYTQQQAQIAVDKAIKYLRNELKGSWKNQTVFIADDGDNNQHVAACDSVADMTIHNYPDMLVRKLYLDAYTEEVTASGESYPLVNELFDNYVKNGVLMFNYMGHGGHAVWTNEGLLTEKRIVNMYNEKYPVFVTATCDFSRFDGLSQSGGELLLLNDHGGAIVLFTTTRTVYAEPNFLLNLQFSKFIFSRDEQGLPLRFGDVMRKAKNARGNDSNKMNFTLLGDPALEMAYPTSHDVVADSVVLSSTEHATDTIRALSKVRLYGHVSKEKQTEVDEDFNGEVSVNVFDKLETIKTLCNDATETANNTPYVFTDRTNALFVGSSEVKNGRFVTEFIVPRDIHYNYGSGRMVFYASDTNNDYEGNGYFEQFIIGGEDAFASNDSAGPQVSIYLNTPRFRSGDKVNPSPLFIANVSDENGINTIGSGIGHDIMLKLDNDVRQEYNLNAYYTSAMGDYTSGQVKYQFSNLKEGKHHLLFRVWDLYNNSTVREFDFEVVNDLAPYISNVYAYPNPATTSVTFVYEHDRPEQPLSLSCEVSDLYGRIVDSSSQIVYVYDNRSEIVWHFPANLSNGIYIVRMRIQVSDSKITTHTIKLLVNRQ